MSSKLEKHVGIALTVTGVGLILFAVGYLIAKAAGWVA